MATRRSSAPARPPAARRTRAATPRPRAVIGIGASAGGLDAIERFFACMPPDSGFAFVVVTHLAPTSKSMLTELLAGSTSMPVSAARNGMQVAADRVYVLPPNAVLTIDDDRLTLRRRGPLHGPPLPIDTFLRSLAEDRGESAVAIILSGTGSDGTLGLQAIKEHGGMAMAQAEASARFGGMPRSAAATGVVDYVLAVEAMPAALLEYLRRAGTAAASATATTPDDETTRALASIFALLRSRTGRDFQQYKHNTVMRRIERRRHLRHVDGLAAYVTLLRENPAEIDALFKDLLIGVTQFFRDPEAFEALRTRVLPAIFRDHDRDAPVRVWVPACATGEEVYSLAMLLIEERAAQAVEVPLQIFATDLDEDALAVARAGSYPDSIAAAVGAARLERFFEARGAAYRITKAVRELVVFAPHDLTRDPPFSRLDLVSCRNVLIYLGAELQQGVLARLHGALRPGGHLFLGPSESIGRAASLFRTVDAKHKIFATLPTSGRVAAQRPPAAAAPPESGASLARLVDRVLLDAYAPACVIINAAHEVVLFHGQTGRYLEPPPGAPDLNLFRMARPRLARSLRAAVEQATRQQRAVRARYGAVGAADAADLVVRPVAAGDAARGLLMVIFESPDGGRRVPGRGRPAAAAARRPHTSALEHELQEARAALQVRFEQLETANEELKSANEELLSINEEHQSSNEELETSREELQSVNEELETVNAELTSAIADIKRANSDVHNLLAATSIATLFLDRQLRIRSFTPATTAIFSLIPGDVGRPITDIARRVAYDELVTDVEEVLHTLSPRERELRGAGDTCFAMRMLPYRTVDQVIDGVVVTFVDVSERRRAELVVEKARRHAEAIVSAVRAPLLILDGQLRIHSANPAFHRLFAVSAAEIAGAALYDIGGGQWAAPPLRARLEAVVPDGASFDDLALEGTFPRVGFRRLLLNARRLDAPGAAGDTILLAIEDVTAAASPA